MHDSAARAPRGGRERRVGLRKPVVVRRDRRTAYRHAGGLLAGPIGFPKAHPSLRPGERAVRVRTETLPTRGGMASSAIGCATVDAGQTTQAALTRRPEAMAYGTRLIWAVAIALTL